MRRPLITAVTIVCAGAVALVAAGEGARDARAQDKHSADIAALLRQADAVTKSVSSLRGLAKKREFKRGVMSKAQIREHTIRRVKQEYPGDYLQREELMLKRFGMLALSDSYIDAALKLLGDEIAGFYDPFTGELYIASWITMGADAVLAHEIGHALQDQHFGLRAFMLADKGHTDRTMARQAVVEGDGMAIMLEYLARAAGKDDPWSEDGFVDKMWPLIDTELASSGAGAPLALRESLSFPYRVGLPFVAQFRRRRGWSRVDQIFKNPPRSTEQVIHPEKYIAGEAPIEIKEAATVAALPAHKLAYSNVVGEQGIASLLLAHGVPRVRAERAAAGWGGDRVAVYAPAGKSYSVPASVGALYTVWDTEADAVEFFDALTHAVPKLAGGAQVSRADSHISYRDTAGAITIAERRAGSVLVLIGLPPARSDDIRNAVWQSYKVVR